MDVQVATLEISRKAGMVPLQMELGGKDVCIVCADANIDLAAKSIVTGGLSYQGQRCTAVKVVMVDEKVADELVKKVLERVGALKVGKPEDDADICAVISESSANWIEKLVMGTLQLDSIAMAPCSGSSHI
jgi:glyceraldehyde-3-phosphate dehydrogenase (NADP+)